MNVARRVAALVAAVIVVAAARPAAAQLTLGGFNIEGDVEAGVRFLPNEPSHAQRAKFEEYRDFTQGLFLGGLQLRIFRPDESYSASFAGSKWGQQDQEFALRAARLGLWEFGFDWDQTPHLFSTTSRLLASQPEPNVFVLPTPRPPLSAYNFGRRLDEVGMRWDTGRVFVSVTPTPDLELRAEYTRIKKDGDRPFSIAFGSPGNNFLEILEPIDQTVHDLRLRATFARDTWQLQAGYTFSMFDNGFRGIVADNPCFGLTAALTAASPGCGADATGAPPTGLISAAPNNSAHTFNFNGGINVPWWRTRITANASYSLRLQNDSFLGFTVNSAATSPALTLPARSLDGTVNVTNANVTVTSRPLPPLTLTAKYRIFDYHDTSPELHFSGDVVNDRTLTLGAFIVPRYNFTRQNADLDARWRFGPPLAVTAGVGWEGWNRNRNREVENSNEYFGKVAVDATPVEWFLGRLTYRPSFRRIGNYNTDSPAQAGSPDSLNLTSINLGQSLLLRKFDEADRDTQRVDLLLQFVPIETLTAAITGGWRFDDYINSPLGLKEATNWSAGLDLTWTPFERVSFMGGYVHELIFQKQMSQNRVVNANNVVPDFPDFVWLSNNTDTVDTFYVGANVALIPGTLDWKLGLNYSTATGQVSTRNPNGAPTSGTDAQNFTASAKRFPAFVDTLVRVDTGLRYHFAKNWTAGLAYAYEQFTKADWRTDTLNPFVPGVSSIWLGNDPKNYAAHIVAVTIGYRFK